MRAQDAANLKKIHDAMLNQAKAAAEAHESVQFKDHVHPVMMEIKGLLASSDSLNDKSLEAIAQVETGSLEHRCIIQVKSLVGSVFKDWKTHSHHHI
jgi:hypothetical protein